MSANPLDPLGRGGAAHKPQQQQQQQQHHHQQQQQHHQQQQKDYSHLFFVLHVLVIGLFIVLLLRVGVKSLLMHLKAALYRLFGQSQQQQQQPGQQQHGQQYHSKYE